MHLLRAFSALLLLAVCASAGEPMPAKLVEKVDVIKDIWVLDETMDGLVFALDKEGRSKSDLKRNRYLRVDYSEDPDGAGVDWLRGNALADKGETAKAYESYVKATGARWQWVRERAAIRAAELAIQLGQPENALAVIAKLEKDAPRSVQLPRATYLRGAAELKKGDKAAAAKTFAGLAGKGGDWGAPAAALGLQGQAETLIADGKQAEAATAVAAGLPKIPADLADERAALGMLLGQAFAATAKPVEAAAAFRDVAYGAPESEARARAHLAWARLTAESTEPDGLRAAFDQALAATVAGAGGQAASEAATLARQILSRINGHAGIPDAEKAEYRRYKL